MAVETERDPQTVGELVRFLRTQRRLTQMELALDANLSTKHLSFVETGRSRPSRQLLVHLTCRDRDEASRSARRNGSGCRTDGLACNALPIMVSLRRRTGGSCCGALRNEAPSLAATLFETCMAPGDELSGRPPSHTL